MAAYPYSGYAGTPQYYDYSTSASNSPAPDDGAYGYAIPAFQTPQGKRHHTRAASYQSPRMYPSPAHFPSPGYYANHYDYSSPPVAHYDYVSTHKTSTRKSKRDESPLRHKSKSKPKQRVHLDDAGDASDYDAHVRPVYTTVRPRAGSSAAAFVRTTTAFVKKRPVSSSTDKAFVQAYETSTDNPVRSRARRASASQHSTPKRSSRSAPNPKPLALEATAADARRYNIPAGYSLKNWDPTEEPILLLGSAFDSNSLGKWIYDWTVYHHRAGAPITEMAGDLWLLLIKFSGKMKRAEECLPRIRNHNNRATMEQYLRSGDKIWGKNKMLLETCEKYMWKGAKKDGDKVSMGEKSGVEFVKTIFGRDRELERTEKLMASIGLWNLQFDTNCEDILRRPSAN